MLINTSHVCDVLIVGSGLAGIMAAVEASIEGQTVILACNGPVFSGSSFYPGTWGLGLIGPENQNDEEDLIQTILSVGCGMADEKMVRSFVQGINPAIADIKSMNVELKQAQAQGEKDFIPCFDHKHRAWNGILFGSIKEVFSKKIQELNIQVMPHYELLELTKHQEQITGAVFINKNLQLERICCKAVVLATGGYGGLYENKLTTDEVTGVGQYLALKSGCTLVNMEFMQMMLGYLSPCYRTIFNEKTFRYVNMYNDKNDDILENMSNKDTLLYMRSGYGPFTSRLESKAIDLAIVNACHNSPNGVKLEYTPEISTNMPEFIKTYFDWLLENKKLTVNDSINLDIFAHAANGGIRINEDASTNIKGLFACGEVTGGMHGADRLGGLSSANGLVFGKRAGLSSAKFANSITTSVSHDWAFELWTIPDCDKIKKTMQKVMQKEAMVIRSKSGLKQGIAVIDTLIASCVKTPAKDLANIAVSRRIWAQLNLSHCILTAELLRTESRGSHYREDYPVTDTSLSKRILITRQDNQNTVNFESEL